MNLFGLLLACELANAVATATPTTPSLGTSSVWKSRNGKERDAITKLNHSIREWEKSAEQRIWEWGCWCYWIKDTVPHGEFENTIKKVTFKSVRSARYAMTYIDQCEESQDIIPYHPNLRIKSATVAVLESPVIGHMSDDVEHF
jgi:hypothetical protein